MLCRGMFCPVGQLEHQFMLQRLHDRDQLAAVRSITIATTGI